LVAECYGDVAYRESETNLFLDLKPSVKQRIGLEHELMISWRWEW